MIATFRVSSMSTHITETACAAGYSGTSGRWAPRAVEDGDAAIAQGPRPQHVPVELVAAPGAPVEPHQEDAIALEGRDGCVGRNDGVVEVLRDAARAFLHL